MKTTKNAKAAKIKPTGRLTCPLLGDESSDLIFRDGKRQFWLVRDATSAEHDEIWQEEKTSIDPARCHRISANEAFRLAAGFFRESSCNSSGVSEMLELAAGMAPDCDHIRDAACGKLFDCEKQEIQKIAKKLGCSPVEAMTRIQRRIRDDHVGYESKFAMEVDAEKAEMQYALEMWNQNKLKAA